MIEPLHTVESKLDVVDATDPGPAGEVVPNAFVDELASAGRHSYATPCAFFTDSAIARLNVSWSSPFVTVDRFNILVSWSK